MPAHMKAAIDRTFEKTLAALVNSGEPQLLQGGRKGVEKESLRVTPDGRIAQTPHPPALGSALTNDAITTDYSEALIELVSPTFRTTWELLQYLLDLHQFVYQHLGDELLWATSMPSVIDGDDSIPIAQYGRSNIGRMKTVYRNGLGVRYGRMMQAISGVHFNYSFPERLWDAWPDLVQSRERGQPFISERYFTCCATTAATAGWCCTCSVCHQWCATPSCADATSRFRASRRTPRTSPTRPRCA